jgi:hypothetical protein
LRAKLVRDLGKYPYSRHSVVKGKERNDCQDLGYVLGNFSQDIGTFRRGPPITPAEDTPGPLFE